MTRVLCLPLLAVAVLFQAAADQEVVFRSDVSLIRVDAQVLDRDNRAITGLGAADFIVREDGQPQPIRNFASENMPIDVLLLLDVSGSMRPHVQRISSAAHQALAAFSKDDRVAIMVFDRASRLRLPFRGRLGDVERELEWLLRDETFDGGTDITRALLDAADYVASAGRRDARRAIVILTDDQTERYRDEEGVSRALTRADAVLSALLAPNALRNRPGQMGGIIIGGRGPYGGRRPGSVGVPSRTQSAGTAEIARQSGGDSVPVDDAYALESTLGRLRQRYALYFYLPPGVKPGEERQIEVQLADAARRRYPGAEVRYRRAYVAPGASTDSPEPVSTPDDQPPRIRRRPAVDGSTTVRDRPAELPTQDSSGGWKRVDEPVADGPGWRQIKPGEKQ